MAARCCYVAECGCLESHVLDVERSGFIAKGTPWGGPLARFALVMARCTDPVASWVLRVPSGLAVLGDRPISGLVLSGLSTVCYPQLRPFFRLIPIIFLVGGNC